MVSVAELKLLITGKNEASQVLKDVDGDAGKLGRTFAGVGTVIGGVLSAQAISTGVSNLKGFIGGAIQGASDLEQTIGGVESVFKGSAPEILAFGENAAQSVGLSKNAFGQLAAPLGAMLKSAGFGMGEVSDKTIDLTTKAADLAATFGGPVEDAMQAIGSLMRGETNPIERYGVAIKQSDVNMKALAMTGKQSEKDLTPLELQQARLALLFEQTADSEGQFAREADTAAGKAERLKAEQENLAAEMGMHLLPIQLKITEAKAKFVELLATKVIPVVAQYAPKLMAIASAIGDAVIPVVREFVDKHGPAIRDMFQFVGEKIVEFGGIAKEQFAKFQVYYREDIQPALDNIMTAISEVVAFIQEHWPEIERIVRPVLEQVALIIQTTFEVITGILNVFIQLLGGDFSGAWNALKGVVGTVMSSIVETVGNALELLRGLGGLALEVMLFVGNKLKDGIVEGILAILRWFSDLPGLILGALGDLGRLLWQKGKDLIQGLVDGMKSIPVPNPLDLVPGGGFIGGAIGKIPGFANGVQNFRGGFAVVGERGPELVNLPRGASVYPLNRSAMGSPTVNITIMGSVSSDTLAELEQRLDRWWERAKEREFGSAALQWGAA